MERTPRRRRKGVVHSLKGKGEKGGRLGLY